MDENGHQDGQQPSTRELGHAFGWIGGSVAVVIGLLVWLVAATVSCGCTTPSAMDVINLAAGDATLEWQTDGLFGTPVFGASGRAVVTGCEATSPPLGLGSRHHVTLTAVGETWTGTVDVPRDWDAGALVRVVIHADGTIEAVHTWTTPSPPYCEG